MGHLRVVRKMSGLAQALLGARTPSPPGARRRRPADRRAARASATPAAAAAASTVVRVKRLTVRVDEQDADDVIDLGAPRRCRAPPAPRPRRRCFYTPNPRLYPGPERKIKFAAAVQRRRTRLFRRPVPNSRLYRPVVRPPPPPATPRAAWPPPPPPHAVETASRAALRLAQTRPAPQPTKVSKASGRQRRPIRPPPPRPSPAPPARTARRAPSPPPHPPPPPPPRSRRLVVKLPAAGDAYRPVSEHFRARAAPVDLPSGATSPTGGAPDMDYRSSPDASDGNDSQSAPSEYLAEFLSAIMQRQYAEALKYCRLILQYEPHNATARGFYPLLQQKLAQPARRRALGSPPSPRSPRPSRSPRRVQARDADSEPSSASVDEAATMPRPAPHEVMEQEADSSSPPGWRGRSGSSGSAASESLELDSSPERSERTADSASGSGGWDTSSARDDNGNLPAAATCACDADNNTALATSSAHAASPRRRALLQSEDSTASLRRLRAQFACSIK